MGYTNEQTECVMKMRVIWRYFIKEMLYSDDQKLVPVLYAALFKFYLEIDNETPGQVGGWIGWQIVRSYMKTMKYLCNN
jgi:hypothetical protein